MSNTVSSTTSALFACIMEVSSIKMERVASRRRLAKEYAIRLSGLAAVRNWLSLSDEVAIAGRRRDDRQSDVATMVLGVIAELGYTVKVVQGVRYIVLGTLTVADMAAIQLDAVLSSFDN